MRNYFLSLLLVFSFVFVYGQNAMSQVTRVQFKVPITLTNGSESRIVWIGVSGDGPNPPGTLVDNTIGVDTDPGFGIYQEALAPPPPPPPFSFDVRITTIPGRVSTFPTGLAGGVFQDYRGFFNTNQIDSFKIVISGEDTDNNPTTISWPSNLNLNATIWTIKPQTGTQWPTTNMLTSGSVQIPPGATRNIIIIKTGAIMPLPTYTLDVTTVGSGIVVKNPDQTNYTSGTSVQLIATPNSPWIFKNWSGDTSSSVNPLSIIMNSNKNITATFLLPKPPVINGVGRSVKVPANAAPVSVTATIVDSIGINRVWLRFTKNGISIDSVEMNRVSGTMQNGNYSGIIPGSVNTNGTRVEYVIRAISLSGRDSITSISSSNSYFAGISPLSLTGVRAMDSNGKILYTGYYCRVTGTVNSPNFNLLEGKISYMFQDAVGGINLSKASTIVPALSFGDSIIVVGSIGQFRGITQITPDTSSTEINIVSTSRPVSISQVSVAAYNSNPEQFESRLIRMIGLNRLRQTPAWGSDVFIPVYQGIVGDSSIMFIDGDTGLQNSPEPTYPVTVTGVATQFTSTPTIYNNGYQIAPRFTTDFTWDTEFEPNNNAATANFIILGIAMNANLTPAGDVDWFRFVSTNEHLVVDATNLNNTIDLILSLYDSSGTKLLYTIDRNKNDRLEFNLEYSGIYFINVRGYSNATGQYTLFARIAPGTDHLEPDDGPLFGFPLIATSIPPFYRDSLATINPGVGLPGYDIDYRYLFLTAGQQVTAILKTKSIFPLSTMNGGYLGIGRKGIATSLIPQVLGGAPLASNFSTTGTDVTLIHTASVTDTYYVFVSIHLQPPSPFGLNQAGPDAFYQIIIDRTVGLDDKLEIPSVYNLEQNFPNPFNPETIINYQLPLSGFVSLKLYNVLGKEVCTLVDEYKEAGYHNIKFSSYGDLSSGIYYYRLQSGDFVSVKKMMLMK